MALEKRAASSVAVVAAGAGVGVLGGLIGLGGPEFRLPLVIDAFGFAVLGAVILNKATSLIVVLTALPVRLAGDFPRPVVASLERRDQPACRQSAQRVDGAVFLVSTHLGSVDELGLGGAGQVVAGVVAGYLIGLAVSVTGERLLAGGRFDRSDAAEASERGFVAAAAGCHQAR